MSKQKPDANQNVARVAGEFATRSESALPVNVEAAWEAWSKGIGKVDSRTTAPLRAAFEVGGGRGSTNVRQPTA